MPTATGAHADSPVRVVLVSKVRLFREALARLVRRRSAVCIVAATDLDGDIFPLLSEVAPDVVLLDIGSDGALALGTKVIVHQPHLAVLGFAVEESEAQIIACAEAGLSGYVPCSATIDELIAAIRHAANGNTVCSEQMAGGLFRYLGRAAMTRSGSSLGGLTRRQQQIARLLDEGLSNKEIARRLSLETATVKNHVHNILERLHVSRRTQVAARVWGASPAELRRRL